MSFRGGFCRFVFCSILAMASMGGAPMRPDEIEELMWTMNQMKIEQTLDAAGEDQSFTEPTMPAS